LIGYIISNIYKIWVFIFDKVIIIYNVIFDKNILYKKNYKYTKGYSIEIIKDIVELFLENKIQDTESIFKNKEL
jgi:hypothetical protein